MRKPREPETEVQPFRCVKCGEAVNKTTKRDCACTRHLTPRFTVEESKVWRHESGRTASIFGACPWGQSSEEKEWSLVSVGWTVRDGLRGTVGLGRVPFKTREEAQEHVDALHAQRAAHAARLARRSTP